MSTLVHVIIVIAAALVSWSVGFFMGGRIGVRYAIRMFETNFAAAMKADLETRAQTIAERADGGSVKMTMAVGK